MNSGLIKPDGTPLVARQAARPVARYLRDTKSGVIASRIAPLTRHEEDVRRSWERAAGLAMDLIQNSGRLKGATDQVLADTVGVGLTLSPQPDLQPLGWSGEEETAFIRTVKKRWRRYWNSASEVSMNGKLTGPQLVDIGLRWHIAYGEATGVFDFFDAATRRRYGVTTGTKLRLVPPHRLVQDTNAPAGLFQGVQHDENGRVMSYRFRTGPAGLERAEDFPAFDSEGRPLVMHIFDPMDSEDVRGISLLAPAFRKHIQAEMLDDATLQMAILQTVFAITLTSEAPSQDAFEALEALREAGEGGKTIAAEYMGYLGAQLDRAADSRVSVGADPQVSHLGPGEDLSLKTANVPGKDFLPFSGSLARDMARTIGITYGGLTMDHTQSTYSSVRMENASIWSVVMRRRERIAAPMCQMTYEQWLDEEIGEGRIPFKGGYAAFLAQRGSVVGANWQGPAKPTADDYKSARAATERLGNGTSSIAIETGDLGTDPDSLFEERQREHRRYVDAGMASPYAAREDAPVIQTEPLP
ncbi:phage portal protein [Pseudooceanicola sp. CBS1P-1]|uniref:Phage portal protein n=1 Tax=Pseudooceanicola albus TaxID=2692189 RepID=A0A6L7FYM4_9RHOB|nr:MULTISPECIES: phage portal protein [Pseudooceanicola]MBT9383319.1 phage portal protein [Pseudooceanicola endophyticus]MXN16358.1 phage portal protein [Pseudooceanicola albus]